MDGGAQNLVVAPGRDAPLRQFLRPFAEFLARDGVTDLAINRPAELWLESETGWERFDAPFANLRFIQDLVQLIATFAGQVCNEAHPLLSGTLPDGERVQLVVPPAVEPGLVSITIRKPSYVTKTPEQYDGGGLLDEVIEPVSELTPVETELVDLRERKEYWGFFRRAVEEKMNIVISGATGSGKTTFGKTIIEFIPPHERMITIEDAREILLPKHPNAVNLLYSSTNSGASKVDAKELLQSCLRMKPSRILLAEIRSKVAYDYIVNVSSGHPGSITTVHAGNCAEAIEMLMMRMKESAEGQALTRPEIIGLLRAKVDVVIQLTVFERFDATTGKVKKVRRITEIYYQPKSKRDVLR